MGQTSQKSGDLQWRVINKAIATNRYVSHLNPAVRGECEFCGEEETVENLFLNCKRLEELFKVLMEWFRSFGETFFQKVFL